MPALIQPGVMIFEGVDYANASDLASELKQLRARVAELEEEKKQAEEAYAEANALNDELTAQLHVEKKAVEQEKTNGIKLTDRLNFYKEALGKSHDLLCKGYNFGFAVTGASSFGVGSSYYIYDLKHWAKEALMFINSLNKTLASGYLGETSDFANAAYSAHELNKMAKLYLEEDAPYPDPFWSEKKELAPCGDPSCLGCSAQSLLTAPKFWKNKKW